MRKIILFILLLVITAPVLYASDSGFDAYVAKDYHKAETIFLNELKQDPDNPLLLYNLGVVSEKEELYGHAVYFYLQTLQVAPDFKEAEHNLKILEENLSLKIPHSLMEKNAPLEIPLVLFMLSIYFVVAALIFFMFKPSWKIKIALIPLFTAAIFFTAFFLYRHNEYYSVKTAIALFQTDLKSGPDNALTSIGKTGEGDTLIVEETNNGWARVKNFKTNEEGWLEIQNMALLKRRSN